MANANQVLRNNLDQPLLFIYIFAYFHIFRAVVLPPFAGNGPNLVSVEMKEPVKIRGNQNKSYTANFLAG